MAAATGILTNQPAHLSSNVRHWRNLEMGAFFQDDWKITRRLTLNLGMRYDLYGRHTELNNQVTTFIKGPGNSFIDNVTTGAGQIKDASVPCTDPQAQLAEFAAREGSLPPRAWARATTITLDPA